MFDELLKGNAVDKDDCRDLDVVRLHEPMRVQAPILVTLQVRVMYSRPPAPVRGDDGEPQDRADVRPHGITLRLSGRALT